MQLPSLRILSAFLLGCLATQTKAYPAAGWPPMYAQAPQYQDDDYYYSPKVQYYYGQPTKHIPEVYGRVPYPYYYDQYSHYAEEDPIRQDERLAALPVGQETWYETETEPSWRPSDLDDVNAAFLDNLILTQMAQDAQRRREYARSSLPAHDYIDEPHERAVEDEDVRELKALAGKPLYHVPKTAPRFDDDDDEDYQADDGFINWNGNKRSVTTAAPAGPTHKPKEGQDEIMVPRPASTHQHKHAEENKKDSVYEKITQLLAAEARAEDHSQKEQLKSRRIDKRFVASDADLVAELRGLKHRIRT